MLSFLKNVRSKKIFYQGKPLSKTSLLESHGPEGKVKGTLQQILDRYLTLGKEAMREGNGSVAQSFFQHAEHYRRVFASIKKIEVNESFDSNRESSPPESFVTILKEQVETQEEL